MNNHKQKFFILGTLFGVFLSFTALAVFLYLPVILSNSSEEISTDQAILLLKNKKIKEAYFRGDQVNFTDVNDKNHLSAIKSDANREILYKEIYQFTENNPAAMTLSEQPANNGLNLLKFVNVLLYLIIAFCVIYSLYKYLTFRTENEDLE